MVKNFVYPIHLQLSARNEDELRRQTDDLPTDFPLLESDGLFSSFDTFVYCATDSSGKLIGAIGCTDYKNYDSTQIHSILYFLFIHKDFRGKGIGSALLARLLEDASMRGVCCMKLVSVRDVYDAAIALYESRGFVVHNEFTNHD